MNTFCQLVAFQFTETQSGFIVALFIALAVRWLLWLCLERRDQEKALSKKKEQTS